MAPFAAGSAPAATADDDSLGKAYDARLVRRLLAYVRPYRRSVGTALLCIAVASASQLVGPLLTRWVIDVAFPARNAQLVVQVAFAFVAVLLVQFGATYVETVVTSRIGQQVMRDLRRDVFAHLQRLPISWFDRNPVGRLVTRVTSDVEALNELFTAGVVAGLGDLFTLFAIGVAMLIVDWPLALAAFVVIPLVLWVSRQFRSRVRTSYRDIRTRLARVNAFLGERLAGVRLVQLFGRERSERQRFQELNDAHLDAHLASITVYALYFPAIEFLTTLALASLLVTAGFQIGDPALSVGTVAAFLQLVRRFFQPLQDLSEKYNILQAAMAAAERLFALLDTPAAPGVSTLIATTATASHEAQIATLRQQGITVTFDDVWFAYEAGGISEDRTIRDRMVTPVAHPNAATAWVLRGVSFTASPGRSLALVGHTGAGKTTIVNLLLRFYEPQRGRILINGTDIRELPVQVVRAVVGYVQQDIFLFAGDIAANVRLSGQATDAALEQAAQRVGADRVIDRLPGRWQHVLGERGGGVSVGERQLLAFARAIAADPAVLVLDEATSAVDSAIESQIQRALDTLMEGRTTIAIAHRLSTIVGADEILVLHHGEVMERGGHRELLERKGLYERLYRLQVGAIPESDSAIGGTVHAVGQPKSTPEDGNRVPRLPSDATPG
ncbi:MAG: ABC transporter ATP-binding protein [Gemmatimonadaceae bacterium]|nr:ABC transporter ATP-binding protein [Gemmatimonadaceae bacterium]